MFCYQSNYNYIFHCLLSPIINDISVRDMLVKGRGNISAMSWRPVLAVEEAGVPFLFRCVQNFAILKSKGVQIKKSTNLSYSTFGARVVQ
jgi:hypothetical protein